MRFINIFAKVIPNMGGESVWPPGIRIWELPTHWSLGYLLFAAR